MGVHFKDEEWFSPLQGACERVCISPVPDKY